jgi:hypothetical protein
MPVSSLKADPRGAMTKILLTILLLFPWTLLFMLVAPLARRSLSRRRNPPKKQLPVTPLARD